MKQGIQTNFPDSNLQQNGCYYFCLLQWAESIKMSPVAFDTTDIKEAFERHKTKGWIEHDCFVVNPVEILNDLIGAQMYSTVNKTPVGPTTARYLIYLKKPGFKHFVLYNNGDMWDSLDPNRAGVHDYVIDSYRRIV